jgi:hypothetical protein
LEAIIEAAELRRAEEQAAIQVETTIPHFAWAGRARSRADPIKGTKARPIPVLMRALGNHRGKRALAHTVMKLKAPPGRPTSMVWNLE